MDEHAVAGIGAGVLTAAVLHPLDLLKIRYHVRDGVHRATFPSLPAAVRTVWQELGWRGLFHGTVPGCIGAGVSWGSYFFLYERIKGALQSRRPAGSHQRLGMLEHLYAGWQASFLTAFLNVPLFLVKTRMELHKPGRPLPPTPPPMELHKPGRPVPPTPPPVAPPPAPTGMSSPPAAGRAHSTHAAPPAATLRADGSAGHIPRGTAAAAVGGAAVGGGGGGSVQHTGDPSRHPYASMRSSFAHIVRTEGVGGLYRGLPPALAMTVHGGLQFAVYEELKAAYTPPPGWVSAEGGAQGGEGSWGIRERAKWPPSFPPPQEAPAQFAMGSASKLGAITLTYPFQVRRWADGCGRGGGGLAAVVRARASCPALR
jgi:hypothetical protein